MPDVEVLRSFVGRSTEWQELVVEPAQARRFRRAVGLAGPPYGDGRSARFARTLAAPTFLSVLRTIDPALELPVLGPAVNGGNSYRWLQPVYVGERLRRRTQVVEVDTREGRAGPLVFFTTETTVARDDEVVAVGRGTNIYR
jgi:acyl dehydratase